MSAIELYYSSIPTASGPYYAGEDDDDDDTSVSEVERAIFEEQMYRDF